MVSKNIQAPIVRKNNFKMILGLTVENNKARKINVVVI